MIPEIHRMLENWARYRTMGGGSSAYIPAASLIKGSGVLEHKREPYIPVGTIEAGRTEQYVQALPPDLRKVVEERYLTVGSFTEKARRCECSVAAFYRRIDKAHEMIAQSDKEASDDPRD